MNSEKNEWITVKRHNKKSISSQSHQKSISERSNNYYNQIPTIRYNTEARCTASDKCRSYNKTNGSMPHVMKYKGHNKVSHVVYVTCLYCEERNELPMSTFVAEEKKRKPTKIPELPKGDF